MKVILNSGTYIPLPFDFYAFNMILKVGHSNMREFFYRYVLLCSARETRNRGSDNGCKNHQLHNPNICLRNTC